VYGGGGVRVSAFYAGNPRVSLLSAHYSHPLGTGPALHQASRVCSEGLGYSVQNTAYKLQDKYRVQDTGFGAQRSVYRVQGLGYTIKGRGYGVQDRVRVTRTG
jgi:hypothetical protein